MDLAYTTEQDMLAESIQRFIATEYDLTTRKTWLPQTWATARSTGNIC